jgi:pimeloyl-ACP methyl ester carboxylesterase
MTTIIQNQVIVKNNGIKIWTESFGHLNHQPIVLIMGSGCQGILWPTNFCQSLASQGYFVIRYDHRDTGLSTSVDYDANPYSLLDMAADITHILDDYQLETAHMVGMSMGGAIAMIFAAHFPLRVKSLTLLATSTDFRPTYDAMQGNSVNHTLPAPTQKMMDAFKQFQMLPSLTLEDKIESFISMAKITSGDIVIDEALCREIALLNFERMKNPESPNNHHRAIIASFDEHATSSEKIVSPTHVIHGDADPILPVEHGKAVHAAIANSTIDIMSGVGHTLFSDELLSQLVFKIAESHRRSVEKSGVVS